MNFAVTMPIYTIDIMVWKCNGQFKWMAGDEQISAVHVQ